MKFLKISILKVLVIFAVSLLFVACGTPESESPTGSVPPPPPDRSTGLSSSAVKAQLDVKIGSPYQLIQNIEPYVQPVLNQLPHMSSAQRDSVNQLLSDAIISGLDEIMPEAEGDAKKEIRDYLVNYFSKSH